MKRVGFTAPGLTVSSLGALSLAALSLALTGCAAVSEPVTAPSELTVSAAGQEYLAAVCPVNEAWDEVDVAVDQLRIVHARGAAGPNDDKALQDALVQVATVSESAASGLEPVYFTWPESASAEVDKVRETLEADVKQVRRVIALTGDTLVNYTWEGADTNAAAAAAARAALGLPEDPETACAQWDGKPLAGPEASDAKKSS